MFNCLVFLMVVMGVSPDEGKTEVAKVLSDWKESLASYNQSSFEGEVVFEENGGDGLDSGKKSKKKIKILSKNGLKKVTGHEGGGYVQAENENYSFFLRKTKDGEEWVVVELNQGKGHQGLRAISPYPLRTNSQ